MRKYIANITSHPGKQAEQDPACEELRSRLITEYRVQRQKAETKKHLDEISGQYDSSEVILELFDKDGLAPPNMSIEDIIKQYNRLGAQRCWMRVIEEELDKMLQKLDPERYEEEHGEREALLHDLEAKKEEVRRRYLSVEKEKERPWLREVLREALQAMRRSGEMEKLLKLEVTDARICGIRQIETALRYLFATYVTNPAYKVPEDPVMRYTVMRREADWLAITIASIDSKLLSLSELIESGQVYLSGDM